MFNTTQLTSKTHVSNEITFNSVAGTLVKSSAQSKFIDFELGSDVARRFFDSNKPHRVVKINSSLNTTFVQVSILQVMLCGSNKLLVEFIDVGEEWSGW
jgi:hypothetical protein